MVKLEPIPVDITEALDVIKDEVSFEAPPERLALLPAPVYLLGEMLVVIVLARLVWRPARLVFTLPTRLLPVPTPGVYPEPDTLTPFTMEFRGLE